MENLGVLSGVNIYPQPTIGVDTGITTGFALDLSGTKTAYVGSRKLIEVPNIKRVRRSPGQVTGHADSAGVISCNLSFRNMARILALHVGHDGYSRIGGLHIFRFQGAPGLFQVEKEHDDSGAPVTNRECDNISDTISYKFSAEGAAMYDWTPSGSGRRLLNTPLAGPPTLADEDFVASSYFDAFLNRNSVSETECADFSFDLKNAVKRQAKFFTRGTGTKYTGLPRVSGKLGIIFQDYDFLTDAINGADVPMECLWGSADPAVGAPFYMRQRLNARFEENDEDAGGEDMIVQTQNWASCFPRSGGFGAEIVSPTLGTYNVPAASHLGIKYDGGGTIDIPVITGAARTAAQIVADAMAVGAFTAVATADVFAGRPRFTTLAKGSAKTLQIDTAFGGSIHALLGLDNVVRTGYDAIDWVAEVMTDLSVDLA